MTQPHHHVFNALSQGITKSVKIDAILTHLSDKRVIPENFVSTLKSKNGMKILISYLRNRSFKTFLVFVECIFLAQGDAPSKVQSVSIVESMIKAVKDFDERNSTSYAKDIEAIEQKYIKQISSKVTEAMLESSSEQAQALPISEAGLPSSQLEPDEMPEFNYVEEPVQVSFTSDGGLFSLKHFGFSLEVPPFAVPVDKKINLKVGICCYGPFSISEDYLLASDFVVIIVDGIFSKPVRVTMEHCLILPEYKRCNEVIILRADHRKVTEEGLYTFDRCVNPEISPNSPYLSFETNEFCVLCAALENQNFSHQASYGSSTTSITNELSKVCIDDDNPSSGPSSFDHEFHPSVLDRSSSAEYPPQVQQVLSTSSEGGQFSPKSASDESPRKSRYNLRTRRSNSSEGSSSVSPQKRLRAMKRKSHESSAQSNSTGKKRRHSVEYSALLFQPKGRIVNLQTLEPHFAVFIAKNCGGAVKLCRGQAKEILKSETEEAELISIICESALKLEAISSEGWTVESNKTPTVAPADVEFQEKKDLRDRIEQGICPPRILFTAAVKSSAQMKSQIFSCKIIIKGATTFETEEIPFFNVKGRVLSAPNPLGNFQRQDAMDQSCSSQQHPFQENVPPMNYMQPMYHSQQHSFQENIPPMHHGLPMYYNRQHSSQVLPMNYVHHNLPLNYSPTFPLGYNNWSQSAQHQNSPVFPHSDNSQELSQSHGSVALDSPFSWRRTLPLQTSSEDERDRASSFSSITEQYPTLAEYENQLGQELDKEVNRKPILRIFGNDTCIRSWKNTARIGFGLTETQIEQVESDYGRDSCAERGFQAYLRWKKSNNVITNQKLLKALYEAREYDAILNFIQHVNKMK